jgi:ABC-type transport system involved in Fe-S cluster assembly fused permease/ATPase subunit
MNNIYKTQILDGLKKHKLQVLFILLLVLLAKISVIGLPFILKLIIDEIPKYQLEHLSGGLIYLPLLAVGYASFFLSTTLFDEAKVYFSEKLIQPMVAEIGACAFNKLLNLPEAYILSNKSGAVMRDIDRGLKAMQSLSTLFIHTIMPTFLELLFVTIFCFFNYDYWITFIIFSGVFLHGTITVKGSHALAIEKVKLNEADSASAAKLGEAVTNSETIKLFAAEAYETQEFLSSLNSYSTHAIKFQFMHSRLRAYQQLVIAIVLAALLVRASFLAMHNLMSAGEFVLLNALAMQVLLPISFLGSTWKEALRLKADISRLSDLFKIESPNYNALSTNSFLGAAPPSIRFDKVSFLYDGGPAILVDASFWIPSGKFVALVGLSGSGKTTITKLLLGFLSPTSGNIEINQIITNQLARQQFMTFVGVVPQNVTLFHGSVAANIAYGKRSASREEIVNVARLAQIDNFIDSLSSGYETEVGERGLKLSGGERQMLGIARALINDPKMLILDEASSSLDSISESRFIQSAIKARGYRTCLVIAHRLSTIMQADEILVLDNGSIVEQGTHDALLKKDGRYASLWRAQNP